MSFTLRYDLLWKYLFCVFLLHPFCYTLAQSEHAKIKKDFPEIVEDEKRSLALAEQLSSIDLSDLYLIAYKGAINIVLADYAKYPKAKMDYFNSGKKDLEFTIQQNPKSVELRFVRFTIQQKVPKQLRYKNESEDLPFIIDNLSSIKDQTYKKHIKETLRDSGKCAEDQLQVLGF